MRHSELVGMFILAQVCLWLGAARGQEPRLVSFENDAALQGFQIEGDCAVDPNHNHEGGATGALRIGPGGSAFLPLRAEDGSGEVSLWIYDDGTRAPNPKERRAGPRWGIAQSDGRVLVVGVVYAPYLGGDASYSLCPYNPKEKGSTYLSQVKHLSTKREAGWHQWTFHFDPENGLAILHNGKDLNGKKKRIDWNELKMRGFNGVVLFGDEGKDGPQTLWVDDLSVQLGGPMQVAPVEPLPAPPVVPDEDPKPEAPAPILDGLRGRHPRLLFTPEDVAALRERATGGSATFFQDLERYLPSCKPPENDNFLKNGTEAQREGMWKLPTVALHCVIAGDKASFDNALGFLQYLLKCEHWELGKEEDSGMGAANVMAGAALAYDWLYNDLDPAFREDFRKKLLLQARRMYYRGHLQKSPGNHYWQQDPLNNHRWHRDAGLTLAALAVAGDGPGDEWLLAQTLNELRFVHQWLPKDGASHESPTYQIFGLSHLMLAFDAADRCWGADFLKHPYFKQAPSVQLRLRTPGFAYGFNYGDSNEDAHGYYTHSLFKCAAASQDRDIQAGLLDYYHTIPDAFPYGWYGLVWFDPTLTGGSIDKIPHNLFCPDLGLALMRDGWKADNVAMMLKCGPLGGRTLNVFRNEKQIEFVNVAHDDPDANSFLIYANGKILAKSDGYSYRKTTASHNTILVDGQGQKGEGGHWSQPLKKTDMLTMAWMPAWKEDKSGIAVAEGEAAGAYKGLERYRRAAIWAPGCYILLVDDIRAAKPSAITWLVQSKEVEAIDEKAGRWRLKDEEAAMEFQAASPQPFQGQIVDSAAQTRENSLGLKQLQLTAETAEWNVATVFDAWNKKELSVAIQPASDGARIVVDGPGFKDEWTWKPAPDGQTPATFKATRDGKELIAVGPPGAAPRE
ncbi:MAG: heparinase II/III family protein [Candidatus Sumerlaeota bacterium]|nr:heparinase II/III family protein [Candidatus Sumerlaeota bacterium]